MKTSQPAPPEALRIGELARRTGLTVRTLHHYDHIGLLKPSGRSGSGYRLLVMNEPAMQDQSGITQQMIHYIQQASIQSKLDISKKYPPHTSVIPAC